MASRPLQATSVGWLLTSIGHAVAANDWQTLSDFSSADNMVKTCGTVGWYQGSGLFLMLAILNHKWANSPASSRTSADKAVVLTAIAIVWGSSAYYLKKGVTQNGMATAFIGALQLWAYFQ